MNWNPKFLFLLTCTLFNQYLPSKAQNNLPNMPGKWSIDSSDVIAPFGLPKHDLKKESPIGQTFIFMADSTFYIDGMKKQKAKYLLSREGSKTFLTLLMGRGVSTRCEILEATAEAMFYKMEIGDIAFYVHMSKKSQ